MTPDILCNIQNGFERELAVLIIVADTRLVDFLMYHNRFLFALKLVQMYHFFCK